MLQTKHTITVSLAHISKYSCSLFMGGPEKNTSTDVTHNKYKCYFGFANVRFLVFLTHLALCRRTCAFLIFFLSVRKKRAVLHILQKHMNFHSIPCICPNLLLLPSKHSCMFFYHFTVSTSIPFSLISFVWIL